jgi:threonine dehydratase
MIDWEKALAMDQLLSPSRTPSREGVLRAAAKVESVVPCTPLLPLQACGTTIWCKAESLQPMGAFKLRGGWHRLTDLTPEEASRGVVAFSSGNHAQGVAWAAQRLGIAATIVMPTDSPQVKLDGTRALGADVILYDRLNEDRAAIAQRIADEHGSIVVPSYDDPWVVEGQGSAGIEALAQMAESGIAAPDLIVAPCGGGGLAAGLALAIPVARIVIAEPEGWDDMARSLAGGNIVPVGPNPPPTPCDALQTLMVADITFNVLKSRGASGVAVPESAIRKAMTVARDQLDLRLEAGGAIALAAVLSGLVDPGERTLVLLSGGNIDEDRYAAMTA